MNRFGIISAMDCEIQKLKENINDLKEYQIGRHYFYMGSYNEKKIYFTDCGIGKVNSAIATQMLVQKFEPDLIINTGIAGGIDPNLQTLDMVVGTELMYHDFDSKIMKNFFPYMDRFHGDKEVINCIKTNYTDILFGRIITGDQFINDSRKKKELWIQFQAKCCEMEGASIAHTAYANKVPFIVIRTISDLADDLADRTYENFEIDAANKSSRFVLDLISKL